MGALRRLPALRRGGGVLRDPRRRHRHAPAGQGYTELDELLVAVVRAGDDGPPLVISSLLLRPGATIGESLTEQAGQTQRLGPNFGEAGDEEWMAAIGMGRGDTAR